MKRKYTFSLATVAVLGLAAIALPVIAQQTHRHGGGMMGGMMQGGLGMPMLHGRDTTHAEVDELTTLFLRHPDITRSVTNLPNGIETVTESSDPDVAAAITGHVVAMVDRMETGRDPMIPIQSPTLQILFERGNRVITEMVPTETGLRVIQTSDDPEVVAALQTHAAEVTDLADRGMAAVHDSMMGQHGGARGMGPRGMLHRN